MHHQLLKSYLAEKDRLQLVMQARYGKSTVAYVAKRSEHQASCSIVDPSGFAWPGYACPCEPQEGGDKAQGRQGLRYPFGVGVDLCILPQGTSNRSRISALVLMYWA